MINQHVKERYFTVGILLLQFIGIPMGIYSAPFYANLYLHGYEAAFISDRIKTDKRGAIKFKNVPCLNHLMPVLSSYRNTLHLNEQQDTSLLIL